MTTTSSLPTLPWGNEHETQLQRMQVDELFGFMPFATISSFLGAGLTLGVLLETGAGKPAVVWFLLFALVTAYRGLLIYARPRFELDEPGTWGTLVVVANLAAGCLWGVLGAGFMNGAGDYRDLFIVMVICCFVGGSLTSYASIKWAHPAMAMPAVIPPLIFSGFLHETIHTYTILMGIVFLISLLGVTLQLHGRIRERLKLSIQHEDLLEKYALANSQLLKENSDLAHRAAVRLNTARRAQGRADMLARHFEKSPLPMLECDARLNLLSWNAAAERLLGDHLSDLLGQSLLVALFGDDLMQSAPASIQRAARENTPKSVAAKFVDLQMQPHSGTFHITPLAGADGATERVAVVIALDRNGNLKHAA